jgi:hypothetical protein
MQLVGGFSPTQWLVLLAIIVLLFGVKRSDDFSGKISVADANLLRILYRLRVPSKPQNCRAQLTTIHLLCTPSPAGTTHSSPGRKPWEVGKISASPVRATHIF